MIGKLLPLILWGIVGVSAVALNRDYKSMRFQYFVCWFVLMLNLFCKAIIP
jgi:hypothetical protein